MSQYVPRLVAQQRNFSAISNVEVKLMIDSNVVL